MIIFWKKTEKINREWEENNPKDSQDLSDALADGYEYKEQKEYEQRS